MIKSGGGCVKRYPLSGGCNGLWVVRDDREVARGSETVYSMCCWMEEVYVNGCYGFFMEVIWFVVYNSGKIKGQKG